MQKMHVSLVFFRVFLSRNTILFSPCTFHQWCFSSSSLNLSCIWTRFNGRLCFCQTLKHSLSEILSQDWQSVYEVTRPHYNNCQCVQWHDFSLLVYFLCLPHLLTTPPLAPSLQTFIGRFRRNMDSSQNAYNEDTSALVERLDTLEKGLFRSGQSGLNSFQSWEKGQASQITASTLVLNYRKRKMTDMQQWAGCWDTDGGRGTCTVQIQTAEDAGNVWACRKRACVKRFLLVTQDAGASCRWCHKDHDLTTGLSEGHQFNLSKLLFFFTLLLSMNHVEVPHCSSSFFVLCHCKCIFVR